MENQIEPVLNEDDTQSMFNDDELSDEALDRPDNYNLGTGSGCSGGGSAGCGTGG